MSRRKQALAAVLGMVLLAGSAAGAGDWIEIVRGDLCVTEGAIEKAGGERLSVSVPKMRAYANKWTAQSLEMRFTYLGATGGEKPLASGEMRRQFGLKLRAQDPCNLVYVMWRVEPENKLVVSVKRNPQDHTSAQCGNRGYTNIKPAHAAPLATLRNGDSHALRAEMQGESLRVFADNHEVWAGGVGADAGRLDGPVGIRSDNAHLEFQLNAGEARGPHPGYPLTCKTGPDVAE